MAEEDYWESEGGELELEQLGTDALFSLTGGGLAGVLRYGTMAILGLIVYTVYGYLNNAGGKGKNRLHEGVEAGSSGVETGEMDFDTYDVDNQDANYDGPKAVLSCIPFDCPKGRISAATAMDQSNGYLFTYGGETHTDMLDGLSVYDQQHVKWTDIEAVSAHPGKRSQSSMVVVEDLVVLYGGICDPQERGDCVDPAMYIFHIESRQWLQVDCASAAIASSQAEEKARQSAAAANKVREAGVDGYDISDEGEGGALALAQKLQPPARCGHSMNVWRNSIVIVFGGYSEEGYYGDTWSFDMMQLSDDQKEERSRKKKAAESAGDTAEDTGDGRVQWRQIFSTSSSHVPPPRAHHAAVVMGDELIVLGGEDETGATSLVAPGEIEILDIPNETWRVVATTGEGPETCPGMHCHELAATNKLMVISGENAGVFNQLYILDMKTPSPTWSDVRVEWRGDWTMIPGIRTQYTSAVDNLGGSILIFGGESSTGQMHDMLLCLDVAKIMELPDLPEDDGEDDEPAGNNFSGPSALRKGKFA